ncbi:MAG: hypothetical protein R3F50_02315 [Gammaproteobacteria bacterium]
MGQVRGDGLGDDAQHPAHQSWVGSYQEEQGERTISTHWRIGLAGSTSSASRVAFSTM